MSRRGRVSTGRSRWAGTPRDCPLETRKTPRAQHALDTAFQLEVSGNTYDTDTEGTIAAIGDGQEPLFFEDIGPDSTLTGKVVYDVPPKVLKKRLEMRFNELGFGETRGYIALPKLG